MPRVLAYHRPTTLDHALALLVRPDAHPLSGGSALVGRLSLGELRNIEVVDLQALGLADIEAAPGTLTIGATATLADLIDHADVPGLLKDLARAEVPSTLRALASIGGMVADGDADSVMLAALLAHDAVVTVAGPGDDTAEMALADLLASGVAKGQLVTSVALATDGVSAHAATGRTPGDVPIVAAVVRRREDRTTAVALTGVADHPVLVNADDPVAGLAPPGDFRGSPDYRRHLARTLTTRALDLLEEMA